MVLAGERNLLTAAFGWLLAVPRFLSAQHACCSRVRKAARATPPTGRYVKHLADRFHGLAVFDLIRDCRHNASAVLCAFDLLEINGEDIRAQSTREPPLWTVWKIEHLCSPKAGTSFVATAATQSLSLLA